MYSAEYNQIADELIALNDKSDLCSSITLNGDRYNVLSVQTFEEEYDFSEFASLKDFILANIKDLSFLNSAGINIALYGSDVELTEDEFLPFTDIVTKYKGKVKFYVEKELTIV